MNIIKLTVVVLSLCVFVLLTSWFLTLNVYAFFIDFEPYIVGHAFYITEITLTFLLYSLGSYAAIKITRLPPFIAALPVGFTGLVMHYIELGGLNCLGVCGPPLWYDLSSFFKHLLASILVSLVVLYNQRHCRLLVANNKKEFKIPLKLKVTLIVSTVVALLWGRFVFVTVYDNVKTVSLYSTVLKEDRKVKVFLPVGYSENKKYDVLYTLDGESFQNGPLAAVTAKILADVSAIPDIIIVAIDGQGKRSRDFKLANARAVDGRDMAGEASVFYSFLEQELLPQIKRLFSTSGQTLLAGHSDGGLFTTYSFTEHRDTFNAYFAFSPSLNANDKSVERFKAALNGTQEMDNFLYFNLGIERGDMRAAFKQAEIALRDQSPLKLKSKVRYYSLPHALIMVPGYFEALYSYYQTKGW